MNRGPIIQLLLTCLLAGCSGAGERSVDSTSEARPAPVLVLGVDGLEWSVLLPLIREGKLPHLTRLMRDGIFGELVTFRPTYSPIIWTSIATGAQGRDHGIEGFVKKLPDGQEVLYASHHRKVKAIWNILTEAERTVNVIGWWNTYPVEPITGVMVAQTNNSSVDEIRSGRRGWKGALYEGVPAQVHPPELQEKILARLPAIEAALPQRIERVFGDAAESDDGIVRKLWQRCEWSLRADAIYRQIALDVLEEPFDFTAVYFGGTDVVAHRFWRYYEPEAFEHRPTAAEIERYRSFIPAYYEEIDRTIGELLAAAGPANVVVVSDHGMVASRVKARFTPDRRAPELRSGGHWDAPPGVLIAAGPGLARSGLEIDDLTRDAIQPLANVIDVTPTLLALAGVPVGRDMFGKPIESLLAPEHLKRFPLRWVDSHTDAEWIEQRAEHLEDWLVDEERLEQLRSLGYLE